MATQNKLNKNNAGVKRILQEARELAMDPSTDYHAAPLEDDIFEWHCTMRGPQGTDFEGGMYHFRIVLPPEYPFRPPSILMLTPNGRFELNTKICISFTNYHEELWQPAWGVRTAIVALQGFFPLTGQAALGVGAVEYPPAERRRLAALSREWTCPKCEEANSELLPDAPPRESTSHLPSQDETVDHAPSATTRPVSAEPEVSTNTQSPDDTPSSTDPSSPSDPSSGSMQSSSTSENSYATTTTGTAVRQGSERQDSTRLTRAARPPLILDGAIAVLLTMVIAMLFKRFS